MKAPAKSKLGWTLGSNQEAVNKTPTVCTELGLFPWGNRRTGYADAFSLQKHKF